jgi:hypothetical protein
MQGLGTPSAPAPGHLVLGAQEKKPTQLLPASLNMATSGSHCPQAGCAQSPRCRPLPEPGWPRRPHLHLPLSPPWPGPAVVLGEGWCCSLTSHACPSEESSAQRVSGDLDGTCRGTE